MRAILPEKLERGRLRQGEFASMTGDLHGAFVVYGPCSCDLTILSSGRDLEFGWEHVSVSTRRRAPNWQEMCFIKNLFWHEDEWVVQYHPAKTDYVNMHPNCLHLWRPLVDRLPTPPSVLVGYKTEEPK